MTKHNSKIALFLSGEMPDNFGRSVDQILAYNHFWLEHDHKYIQVLFPIDEGTKFNKHASVVTQEDIDIFSNSEELKKSHLRALDLMLEFWGMKRSENEITIELPYSPSKHVWLRTNDHNQLRITRVIRSLYLLGNQQLARNMCDVVVEIGIETGTVSEKAIQYWRNAVEL